jgi:hypothetical protein
MKNSALLFASVTSFLLIPLLCTTPVQAGFIEDLGANLKAIFVKSGDVLGENINMYGTNQLQNNRPAGDHLITPNPAISPDYTREAVGRNIHPSGYPTRFPHPSGEIKPTWKLKPTWKPMPTFRPLPTGFRLPEGLHWSNHTASAGGIPDPTRIAAGIQKFKDRMENEGPAAVSAHVAQYQELMTKFASRRDKLSAAGVDVTQIDQDLLTMEAELGNLKTVANNAMQAAANISTADPKSVSGFVSTWVANIKSASQPLLATAKKLIAEFKTATLSLHPTVSPTGTK